MSLQGEHFPSWQRYKLTGRDLNEMMNKIIREIESAHEVVDLKMQSKDKEIELLKEQVEFLKNQSNRVEYKERIVYKKR